MHRFASVSTSLLFAAHVVLGCCAHHAHGHGSQTGHREAGIGGGCDGVCDHHDAGQTSSHDAGDCPGRPCSHGWCTYVKAEDTRIDRDGSQASWSIFISSPADLRSVGWPTAECVSIVMADARPARLYLLHCALLN